MAEKKQTVNCSTHGVCSQAFVCQHLLTGENLGFNIGYSEDESDNRYPDAWCDACDQLWEIEGDFNEKVKAEADIKLVCSACYGHMRSRNWRQNENDWQAYMALCCEELVKKQKHFNRNFDLSKHERWDWGEEPGTLNFSTDGRVRVQTRFQVAGSLALKSNSWMWAWANESYDQAESKASVLVREFGQENKFLPFVAHLSDATEEDAFHYVAALVKELGALAYYRVPENTEKNLWTYMAITDAEWVSRKKFFGLFG